MATVHLTCRCQARSWRSLRRFAVPTRSAAAMGAIRQCRQEAGDMQRQGSLWADVALVMVVRTGV